DEGEAADPRGQRASGLKKVLAGLHVALEGKTNAHHKHEVQQHDQPINERQLQRFSLGYATTLKTRSPARPAENENVFIACIRPNFEISHGRSQALTE